MEDLRTNKTELYIIIENSCTDGCEEIQTFIFDDEETAHEKFEQLVADDKAFLEEEGRNDTIEEDEDSYCSFPDGEYSTTHYWVSLLKTKNA